MFREIRSLIRVGFFEGKRMYGFCNDDVLGKRRRAPCTVPYTASRKLAEGNQICGNKTDIIQIDIEIIRSPEVQKRQFDFGKIRDERDA